MLHLMNSRVSLSLVQHELDLLFSVLASHIETDFLPSFGLLMTDTFLASESLHLASFLVWKFLFCRVRWTFTASWSSYYTKRPFTFNVERSKYRTSLARKGLKHFWLFSTDMLSNWQRILETVVRWTISIIFLHATRGLLWIWIFIY